MASRSEQARETAREDLRNAEQIAHTLTHGIAPEAMGSLQGLFRDVIAIRDRVRSAREKLDEIAEMGRTELGPRARRLL